ncbi:MAG: T9SS type A sorting domain-containing protein [Bacteroidales bacterium]|nr:T9SS type A sorting domain-containing protein [Bacteroidales bacterium]
MSKCIVPNSSDYSSRCVLPDGTIDFYVEEAYAAASDYSMVFYNISLEWLTDGNDTFDPTGVVENQIQTESLKVYPVPATSFVTIEVEGMKTINVYNALGQLVKSVSVNGTSEIKLDISGWVAGMYFVEGVYGNGLKGCGQLVK